VRGSEKQTARGEQRTVAKMEILHVICWSC